MQIPRYRRKSVFYFIIPFEDSLETHREFDVLEMSRELNERLFKTDIPLCIQLFAFFLLSIS